MIATVANQAPMGRNIKDGACYPPRKKMYR